MCMYVPFPQSKPEVVHLHVMKSYMGSKDIAPLILNVRIRWR